MFSNGTPCVQTYGHSYAPGDGCEAAFADPRLGRLYDVILIYADTYDEARVFPHRFRFTKELTL